jgi:ATP-dependent exoDNAse (exonuclease V) beta subunit
MLNTSFSKQSEDEKSKTMLDELNVVYVALTRAADEIYVLVEEVKDIEKINGVEKFYHQVLPELKEEKDNVFSLGKQTSLLEIYKETKPDKKNGNKELIRSDWRKKIKMSFSAPSIWNVPENSEQIFPEFNSRSLGNIIHTVFARIQKKDDISFVLKTMLKEGLIDNESISTISKTIRENLELKPLIDIWDTGEHIVEKEIINNDGDSYRPDRIIQQNEITYLIDFKTGEEKKEDQYQILNYEKLIKELKFKNISCFLVYTEKNICKQVS